MKTLSIGVTVPALMLAAFVADICSRFVSYDHVSFRPFEALSRSGGTGLGGPFMPAARVRQPRAYGDLAAMGNVVDMRQYRSEIATTDEWGFRNGPSADSRSFGAILFGTSFSMGAGLNDDETLSAQLAKQLGVPIYNAAGLDIGRERELLRVISRLHMRHRVAIVEHMESAPQPVWSGSDVMTVGARLEDRFGDTYRDLRVRYSYVKGWLNESPLKLLLFKIFKDAQDDVFLPNSFSDRVIRDELTNGDPILFLPGQVFPRRAPDVVAQDVRTWTSLNEFFARQGFDLYLVLVPSQYRVYGPLVRQPRSSAWSDTYLAELGQALRQNGISAIDLTPALEGAARAGLRDHRYVYWRDDTHWNSAGAAIAAREIAAHLQDTDRRFR